MVPGLYPGDLLEQAFKSVLFHRQNDFEKDIKIPKYQMKVEAGPRVCLFFLNKKDIIHHLSFGF